MSEVLGKICLGQGLFLRGVGTWGNKSHFYAKMVAWENSREIVNEKSFGLFPFHHRGQDWSQHWNVTFWGWAKQFWGHLPGITAPG